MSTILNHMPTFLPPKAAKKLADRLNREAKEEHDDWTYVVKQSPGSKYAVVNVYDEEGHLIGTL